MLGDFEKMQTLRRVAKAVRPVCSRWKKEKNSVENVVLDITLLRVILLAAQSVMLVGTKTKKGKIDVKPVPIAKQGASQTKSERCA